MYKSSDWSGTARCVFISITLGKFVWCFLFLCCTRPDKLVQILKQYWHWYLTANHLARSGVFFSSRLLGFMSRLLWSQFHLVLQRTCFFAVTSPQKQRKPFSSSSAHSVIPSLRLPYSLCVAAYMHLQIWFTHFNYNAAVVTHVSTMVLTTNLSQSASSIFWIWNSCKVIDNAIMNSLVSVYT